MFHILVLWVAVAIVGYKIFLEKYYAASLSVVGLGATVLYIGYIQVLQLLVRSSAPSETDDLWGLHQTYDGDPSEPGAAVISIIFVHGLDSNPLTTWKLSQGSQTTHLDSGFDWITSLLIPDVLKQLKKSRPTRLRVYHFNYESRWKYASVPGRRRLYGKRLQSELKNILAQETGQLVLVGHSFGGLVIKEALSLPDGEDILTPSSVAGIIFLGTPHRGSSFALFGLCAAFFFLPLRADLSAMMSLRSDSTSLKDLHDDFITKYGYVPMRNFYESDPITLNLLTIEIAQFYVVPESSATFVQKGTENFMLKSNHFTLNKFNTSGDNYRQFCDQLLKMLDERFKLLVDKSGQVSQNGGSRGTDHRVDRMSSQNVEANLLRSVSQRYNYWWYSFAHPRARAVNRMTLQEGIDVRHEHTFQWVDKRSNIDWLKAQEESSLLWLTGPIGSGKTTLCVCMLQNLKRDVQSTSSAILFAFCNSRELASEAHILRELIDQLLEIDQHLQSNAHAAVSAAADAFLIETGVHHAFPQNNESEDIGTSREQTEKHGSWPLQNVNFLWKVLILLMDLATSDCFYIVLDGLDALHAKVSERLLSGLREHVFKTGSPTVKLILSNRTNIENIRYQMLKLNSQRYRCLELDGLSDMQRDVKAYLKAELTRIQDLRGWPKSVMQKALKKAWHSCNNLFLYAGLIVKNLEMCPTYAVEDMLSRTPNDLLELYEMALDGIAHPVRSKQSNILLCLLYAYRDLTLSDILAAIYAPYVKETADIRNGLLHDIMLHGPLLRFDKVTEIVSFIHPTAKEFLLEKANCKDSSYSPFLPDSQLAHEKLAEGSLRYLIALSNKKFPHIWEDYTFRRSERMSEMFPGVNYAFAYWHVHCRTALSRQMDISTTNTLLKALQHLDRLRKRAVADSGFWSRFLRECDGSTIDERCDTVRLSQLSTLEFFSMCGLPEAVEFILKRDKATQSQELAQQSQHRALNLAIASRYPQTINVLINHFQIKSLDGPLYRNMIPASAKLGSPEFVRAIISMRPTRSLCELANALFQAASRKDDALLQDILYDNDVVDERDSNGMSILHWLFWLYIGQDLTLEKAHSIIYTMTFVLSKGADIDSQDNLGNTILHYLAFASGAYQRLVLHKVIENGARTDIENRFGWLPLHLHAYKSGSMLAIRFLDKHDPQTLFRLTRGRSSVLHWAVQRRVHSSSGLILKYFLCRGLDLERPNRDNVRPIDILCTNVGLQYELWSVCETPRPQPLMIEDHADRVLAIEDVPDEAGSVAPSADAESEKDDQEWLDKPNDYDYSDEDYDVDFDDDVDEVLDQGQRLLTNSVAIINSESSAHWWKY